MTKKVGGRADYRGQERTFSGEGTVYIWVVMMVRVTQLYILPKLIKLYTESE